MPRPRSKKPAYCLHKPSSRAYVRLAGKCVYLGQHGTTQSHEEYDRVIAEWIVQGRPGASIDAGADGHTVTQILVAFWSAHQNHYAPYSYDNPPPVGKRPTDELGHFFDALKLLRRTYGPTSAKEFGPLRLKAVRDSMVKIGWSRGYINRQIGRIRRVFKWAVEQELLDGTVHYRLCAVEPLRRGKTPAPDTEPVKPAAEESVKAALPHVSRQVKAMIELQLLSGMRPGEVVRMRLREIDRSSEVWTYTPTKHKTAHHGHQRAIYLGPRAQQILAEFFTLDPDRHLFSPADAEAERREALHEKRKTPAGFGNVPGSNRQARPKRAPGEYYTVDSYRRAIRRACEVPIALPTELEQKRIKTGPKRSRRETRREWKCRLGPELWKKLLKWQRQQRFHPHQLRHTAGTELRKEFGAEAAQTILGHKHLKTTEIYAEKNLAVARKIMRQIG
jgi:integrase